MHRRDFFSQSLSAFMGAMLVSSCRTQVPTIMSSRDRGHLMVSVARNKSESTLRILNLNDYSYRDFLVPLGQPHSMSQNLNNPDDIFLFEFIGGAAKLDLQTGKTLHVPPGKTFFAGHSLQDEEIIWSTEKTQNGDKSAFARNVSDLSLISGEGNQFLAGHHIVKMPGSSLVVSGSHGYVTFFDIRTRKNFRHLPLDPTLFPVHFIPLSETEVIAVGGHMKGNFNKYVDLTKPAPAIYATTSGEIRTFWDEDFIDDFRFGFGLKKLGNSTWLTGHKFGNAVFLWKDYKIVKKLEMKHPQAISLTGDGTQFIVHSSDHLHFYSLKTYELEKTISYDQPILSISEYSSLR